MARWSTKLFWIFVAIWSIWHFVSQWYAFTHPVEKQVYFGWLSWWQVNSLVWYFTAAIVFAVYLNKFWKPVKIREEMMKKKKAER